MKCVAVTPEKTVFDLEVDFVVVPLYDGEYGVGVDHSPVVGRIGAGELRFGALPRFGSPHLRGLIRRGDRWVVPLSEGQIQERRIPPRQPEEILHPGRDRLGLLLHRLIGGVGDRLKDRLIRQRGRRL